MSGDATYRAHVHPRSFLATVAMLAAAAMLLAAFHGSASAAPLVGKDGKIYACYRVKGKPKGAMRLLFKAKKRCARGERRVAWVMAGAPSSTGSAGQTGSVGQPGAAGQSGRDGAQGETDPALAAQISALSLRLDSVESVLDGVTNVDLLGALDSLPLVDDLCTQASTLTTGLNALRAGVLDLSILGDITGLLGLNTSGLPAALNAFTCTAAP